MAGGGLSITFDDGPLKAWFKADCNAILYFKPFYLVAEASLSIEHILPDRFPVRAQDDLGGDRGRPSLWGPPIGGKVHINWYIISFTISFGPGSKSDLVDQLGRVQGAAAFQDAEDPEPAVPRAAPPGYPGRDGRPPAPLGDSDSTTTTPTSPSTPPQGILRTGTIGT